VTRTVRAHCQLSRARTCVLQACSYITVEPPVPQWTWDPDKDARNRRTHQGLSLEDGVPVLEGDRLALSGPDPHPDGDRWQTLGSAGGLVVLLWFTPNPWCSRTAANSVALSASGRQRRMSAKRVKKANSEALKATRDAMDSDQRKRLTVAAAMPDSDIDTSDPDAPEVTDWSGAVRGRFYRPVKQLKSLRIDADVLAYFQAQGSGYQTRINRVLRASMLRDLRRHRL